MKDLERPVNKAAPNDMGWASDVAAEMLRKLNIKYVSLNPGASYRGFHDSLVNYLGNERPELLLCVHEEHAVSLAHGYTRVTGRPLAVALHALACAARLPDRVPAAVSISGLAPFGADGLDWFAGLGPTGEAALRAAAAGRAAKEANAEVEGDPDFTDDPVGIHPFAELGVSGMAGGAC